MVLAAVARLRAKTVARVREGAAAARRLGFSVTTVQWCLVTAKATAALVVVGVEVGIGGSPLPAAQRSLLVEAVTAVVQPQQL